MKKRIAVTLLALLSTAKSWADVVSGGPGVLPAVACGTTSSAPVPITNAGGKAITINAVSASCSCLRVVEYPRSLPPGGHANLKVDFDGHKIAGESTVRILISYIEEGVSKASTLPVSFSSIANTVVTLRPFAVDFGVKSPPEVAPIALTITNDSPENVVIEQPFADEVFDLRPTTWSVPAHGKVEAYLVTKPEPRPGPYDEYLALSANFERSGTHMVIGPIHVSGVVQPSQIKVAGLAKVIDLDGEPPAVVIGLPPEAIRTLRAQGPFTILRISRGEGAQSIVTLGLTDPVETDQMIDSYLELATTPTNGNYLRIPIHTQFKSVDVIDGSSGGCQLVLRIPWARRTLSNDGGIRMADGGSILSFEQRREGDWAVYTFGVSKPGVSTVTVEHARGMEHFVVDISP